jgi:alpha-galactosidase
MQQRNECGSVDVVLRAAPEAGVRYTSGRVVYDEAFIGGRLVGRYWSACGQVRPEMHLPRREYEATDAPLGAFRLGIEGEELLHGWKWLGAREQADESGLRDEAGAARQVVVELAHGTRPITVRVCTRLDGSDWLVRWLEITNTGKTATAISSVCPLAGRVWAHRYDEHIPPGAPSPFDAAYSHSTFWGLEGDLWPEPLRPGRLVFDGERRGKSGWSRPAFWARDLANGHTLVCELAWSGNWQFELDCRMEYARQHAALFFAIGLAPMGVQPLTGPEMLRVVEPGETVRTPAVHAGYFECDADGVVQSLHRHVRHVVMPKAPAGAEVEIEANHRGYMNDTESEPGLKRDIEVAAAVGTEMYVVDAGWYGNEPNLWWLNVGDWHAGAWLPNGLEPVVEHAHKRGMRFGLWMEAEAMGANSTLRKEHADWTVVRHGEPVTKGRPLDLARPEIAAWVEAEIVRVIERYKLDMFRLDHNHDLGLGGTREHAGFVENTLWRYYDALYAIFDRVRARFPAVVLQNCAGGGGRLDLGILQRFHNTELSDWMRQPRGVLIFNGLTMALPPEIGLRTFGTECGEHLLEGDLDSQLRLAFLARPILRGIAPSVEELVPFLKERIAHHVALFKEFIRPLTADCLVFHHTPWLPIRTQTPWCVLEYAAPDKARALVAVFRLLGETKNSYRVRPRGLDRTKRYRVTFDNAGETVELSGHKLVERGLRIELRKPLSSELVLLEAIET